jgi:energy-coupling factor transport system ATP-binding protein
MTSIGTELVPAALRFRGFGWRPAGCQQPVVRDVDLTIEPGQRVLLAGPSGAGKSTLLRAAAGLLGAGTEGDFLGEVLVNGVDAHRHRTPVGVLLQSPLDSVVADRVGRDVAFGPENLGLARNEIWRRVHEALDLVGFPYDAQTPTGSLSGGEAQRLALAGVLALRPGLLLLDEPTSMLDPQAARAVRAAIVQVAEATGTTLVVAEHRLAPWLDVVDRMVVLDSEGSVSADASPAQAMGTEGARLAAVGLWLPGLPAPEPLSFPDRAPDWWSYEPAARLLSADRLQVTLRTRGLRAWREHTALRGADAQLVAGQVTAVTGPSGSGKSTLVAALGGLLEPSAGRVHAAAALARGCGPVPHRWASRDLAARVGWVPQTAEHGFVTSRVRDEVGATAERLGRRVDVEALLAGMRLDHRADADPYRLSGGEQRRLALVAALAHRPPVALLDEPTVGQDRHTWAAVAGWIRAGAQAGGAAAVSTHDAELVAAMAEAEIALDAGLARLVA